MHTSGEWHPGCLKCKVQDTSPGMRLDFGYCRLSGHGLFSGSMAILDDIPLELDVRGIAHRLRARGEKGRERVRSLLNVARPFIHARALYQVCYVEKRQEDSLLIKGMIFKSRVLHRNCEGVERVFPFVVTIGRGLEKEIEARTDPADKYYLDGIGNVAVGMARKSLERHLQSRYALGGMSHMSPGSLTDWPIEEQGPLFALLGDTERAVGVRLCENLFMTPKKSVSGIFFPTEVRFESCQLCPRDPCEGRRAAYNETLASKYGILGKDNENS